MGKEREPFSAVQILICLISVWNTRDPKSHSSIPVGKVRMYTEVNDIRIEDSYKKLIGTAEVKFPKGTVTKSRVIDFINDDYDSKVTANINDSGVIAVTRADSKLATKADFSIGSRIRIELGYTSDPKIAALARPNERGESIFNDEKKLAYYRSRLSTMFDGYITGYSEGSMIELQCENLASCLKKVSCVNILEKKNVTVNDLLADDGKYQLLRGTGFELHPDTIDANIDIGAIQTKDLTVADVLTSWAKFHLYSYVRNENGRNYISVGRMYFGGRKGKDCCVRNEYVDIDFSYHVAKSDIKSQAVDRDYVAIEAQSMSVNGHFYKFLLRKNLNYDPSNPKSPKYEIVNEIDVSKKVQMKGVKIVDNASANMHLYTILPYFSPKVGASKDELQEEAIKRYESYVPNGIRGSITIFGDLALKTGAQVHLIDDRNPSRNGYYVLENVTTNFGVGGYRQTLSLPNRIAKEQAEKDLKKKEQKALTDNIK